MEDGRGQGPRLARAGSGLAEPTMLSSDRGPCLLALPGTWAWPAGEAEAETRSGLGATRGQEEASRPGPEAAVCAKSASEAGPCPASGIWDFQRVPTVPQLTRVACCVQTVCTSDFIAVDSCLPPGRLGFWSLPGRGADVTSSQRTLGAWSPRAVTVRCWGN